MSDSVYKGEDFDLKVRKQVEFYFSDSNLQTDKFLWKIYEANDGWVELKTILTFSRMRQFRPEDKVIAALKESSKLVLSANEDMIRRSDPLKDFNEVKNIRKRNTVHIEGLPSDASQDDLESFFNKLASNFPKENSICSLRRIKKRANNEFFGVIDIELNTQEDAEFLLNDLNFSYPEGVVTEVNEDKKDSLKKMSLLTFQEMRANGKRFGVNEITKRRESFNDSQRKKFKKNPKKDSEAAVEDAPESEAAPVAETTPVVAEIAPVVAETAPVVAETSPVVAEEAAPVVEAVAEPTV